MNVDLEFKQTQVADESGIFKAVVNIIDKKNGLIAEWPPARLDVWLDIIRENPVEPDNLFNCVDIQWKPIEECDNELESNNSLNSSRISLNLSAVKEIVLGHTPEKTNFQKIRNIFSGNKTDMLKSAILNNSSPQKQKDSSVAKNISKTVLFREVVDTETLSPVKMIKDKNCLNDVTKDNNVMDKNFSTSAQVYLRDLRKTTLRFKKLCIQHSSGENINDIDSTTTNCVLNCVEQIEQINNEIKNLLIDKQMVDLTVRTPKSVRFLLD